MIDRCIAGATGQECRCVAGGVAGALPDPQEHVLDEIERRIPAPDFAPQRPLQARPLRGIESFDVVTAAVHGAKSVSGRRCRAITQALSRKAVPLNRNDLY